MLGLRANLMASRMAGRRLFQTGRPVQQSSTSETVQAADKMHGSYHWISERYLSAAMLPLIGFPLAFGPSRTCDFLLGFLLPIHCHLGFGQIITDYLNPRRANAMIYRGAFGALYGATALTIYGLYKFNTTDVGITEFVANLWKGPSKQEDKKVAKPVPAAAEKSHH